MANQCRAVNTKVQHGIHVSCCSFKEANRRLCAEIYTKLFELGVENSMITSVCPFIMSNPTALNMSECPFNPDNPKNELKAYGITINDQGNKPLEK